MLTMIGCGAMPLAHLLTTHCDNRVSGCKVTAQHCHYNKLMGAAAWTRVMMGNT